MTSIPSDEKRVVTYLGPKASYTHQATLDTFEESQYTLSPQITIEDVFTSVQSESAHYGVVPFENSSNGSVIFTLDLFADLQRKFPSILVCGESYISVQHCLLGHFASSWTSGTDAGTSTSGSKLSIVIDSPLSSGVVTPTIEESSPQKSIAKPLTNLSRIRKIYSHPQAWGQCKGFLNTYLKGVETQDVSSTSRAAELAAEDKNGETAAVSSGIAAKIHGLDVLVKGIEDRKDNTTRFLVISKMGTDLSQSETSRSMERATERGWKTLISFTVDHCNPGALAHSLAAFEKYRLNLTSINTRPSGVENWNYIFFVEIKGRKLPGTEDGDVNKALKDLDRVCRGWRWLGSWENRLNT